jgi:hypothetical protein
VVALMEQKTAVFDRRQVYRPFLERLNPSSPSAQDLDAVIVPPEHDPRDPEQPPIHEAFATTAELNRGSQMALVGGIGSGKTTELRLTQRVLKRHKDAVNIFIDLADQTDINELNPGAIMIAIGTSLYVRLNKTDRTNQDIKSAYRKLQELANGKTQWVPVDEYEDQYDEPDFDQPPMRPVRIPGMLKPRFPALKRDVEEVQLLIATIATPFLSADSQITVLLDGLDRLIQPERFRQFAEQDLRALREFPISLIVTAPLLLWFDKDRFLQDYFNEVKHIPAAVSDPQQSEFLKQILIRRGATDVMGDEEISAISRASGGVLRDLITLARTSAEAAYREDRDRIESRHVSIAIRQLGKRYLLGLGKTHRKLIQRLLDEQAFSFESPTGKELLVNRQVLEYFTEGRESFAVHPALAQALRENPQ